MPYKKKKKEISNKIRMSSLYHLFPTIIRYRTNVRLNYYIILFELTS